VQVTRECLDKAIATVRPGAPFNLIGKAIEDHAHAHNFGVVRDFIGHGIGEQFHTDLQVPHYYDPRYTLEMEEGMTFTIEPMITAGSYRIGKIWDDGWTAVTADGSRTAQFEHTILVTASGAEVLTALR
jgi:methionyl aminopeptidase